MSRVCTNGKQFLTSLTNRLCARSVSGSNEMNRADLLQAVTKLVISDPAHLTVKEVSQRWWFLKNIGYQVDFHKDVALFRESPERIYWKTLCLLIEKQTLTVQNLLKVMHSEDPLPINYDVLSSDQAELISQEICKSLIDHGANRERVETSELFRFRDSAFAKRTYYTIYLLMTFFNTTADMIAWQMQSVKSLDQALLIRECSQIDALGLELPDHLLIYLHGTFPEQLSSTKELVARPRLMEIRDLLQMKEIDTHQQKELQVLQRREQSGGTEIHNTFNYLLLQGYKIADIRSCILVLSYKVKAIQKILEHNPEFKEPSLEIQEPKLRLWVLFVMLDREKNFHMIKSIRVNREHNKDPLGGAFVI